MTGVQTCALPIYKLNQPELEDSATLRPKEARRHEEKRKSLVPHFRGMTAWVPHAASFRLAGIAAWDAQLHHSKRGRPMRPPFSIMPRVRHTAGTASQIGRASCMERVCQNV